MWVSPSRTESGKIQMDGASDDEIAIRKKAGKYSVPCHNFLVRKRKLDKDLDQILSPDFEMRGTVCAAPERGLKVRIVSKHDASISGPAHAVRRFLFKGLRRDPRTRSALDGSG